MNTHAETKDVIEKSVSPQARQVWSHMKNVGTITAQEAWHNYGIRSLSRRICDIKEYIRVFNLPYTILSVHKRHPLTKQRYVRYSLIVHKRSK